MRAFLASLALVGVAACQTSASEGQAVPVAAPTEVPVAFAAGPGRRAVTAQLGASVIRSAWVNTRPSFDRTPVAVAGTGRFVQNAQTLAYFHQTYGLSVKLIDGRCSVVMGGLKDADAVIAVRDQAGPAGAILVGRPRRIDGHLYVRVSV